MPVADVAASWQAKLDREFPHGAVCSWDRPGPPVIYLVLRIEVTGAVGLDPVVQLIPLDQSRVLNDLWVQSYTPAAGQWPPGTVRVTFGNEDDGMFWNPQVPAVLQRAAAAAS